MSVDPRGVEKVVRDVKSGIKVTCRDGEFSFGQGAGGICQRIVEVKIA